VITWAQIVLAVLKLSNWIAGAVSQLRWKQAGRDEVTSKVNAKTLETKDAMDSVARPSDESVSDSLRTGKF
jgi:hypothetical protein